MIINTKYLDIKKNNKAIILVLHLIGALISLGTGIPYLTIFSALSATTLIFASNMPTICGVLFFLLPFSPIFKLNPEGHTFFNLLIAVSIIKLLMLNGKMKFTYKQIIAMLLFVIFVIAFGGFNGIVRLINLVAYFILILLIFKQRDKINLRDLIVYFSFGIILASVIGLLSDHIIGLSAFMRQVALKLNPEEYITRLSGVNPNPNHYNMDISIALSVWFSLVVNKHTRKYDFIIIIILSVFGIMSLSKSFLLSYLVMIFLVLLFYGKKGPANLIKGVAITTVVLVGVYFLVGDQYLNILFSRFKISNSLNFDLSSLTTGRSSIAEVYLIHIFANPRVLFLGEGLGAANLGTDSHNFYIEIIYYIGIVGAAFYANCIKNVLPKLNLTYRRTVMNYLPFLILLMRGFAINLMLSEHLYFYYIIIAVALNTNFNTKASAG